MTDVNDLQLANDLNTSESVIEVPKPDIGLQQLEGLGAATDKKLQGYGVTTLYDLCIRGAKEICEITGANQDTCQGWVLKAKAKLEELGLVRKIDMSALELYEYQEAIKKIEIGMKPLDDMFGGGMAPESLYELYGEFGSGKTQFALTACAVVIANGGHVIWLDCEDTFKPARLLEILVERELATDIEEGKKMLSNILIRHVPNTEDYELEEGRLTDYLIEQHAELIIVDGIIGQYAEEYIGRGVLSSRQNKLRRVMTHLKNICFYFSNVILFTNQVQTDPSILWGDPTKPIGGNVVAHASTYRIYFKKQGKKRIARMVDSPKDDLIECQYNISAAGIVDPE
jgi:DNA repair protein RadA